MRIALAALAMFNIEFKVGVTRGDFSYSLQHGLAQRRAAQVGMQDDSGGINYRTQRRPQRLPQLSLYRLRNSLHRHFDAFAVEMTRRYFSTQLSKNAAGSVGNGSVAFGARGFGQIVENFVQRRKQAVEIGFALYIHLHSFQFQVSSFKCIAAFEPLSYAASNIRRVLTRIYRIRGQYAARQPANAGATPT